MGLRDVVTQLPVPIYLHPDDRTLYDGLPEQVALWFGVEWPAPPPPDRALAHGDVVRVGNCLRCAARAWAQPRQCGVRGPRAAIAGDAIFAGSIGRVDLPAATSTR